MAVLGDGSGSGYPGAVDTATTEVDVPDANATIVAAAKINDLATAILAIQTELGTDPAGSVATLVARLTAEHEDDGTHKNVTTDTIVTTGNGTIGGALDVTGGTVKESGLPIGVPVGATSGYMGTTAPSGWVLGEGGTIGNAASGASERDNADTNALFNLMWDSFADGEAPVSSGRGGSAQADFDADKTITLLDYRGRSSVGSGTGSGLTARTHGAQFGEEDHVLTGGENGPHVHMQNRRTAGTVEGPNAPGRNTGTSDDQNTDSAGSGTAHNNMQTNIADTKIIKL